MIRSATVVVLGALLFVGVVHAEPPTEKEVAAVIEDTRKAWQVPGIAVVVVHKDRIVYLHGHGLKEIDKDAAVTPETRFGIGSCTKAMVATALGLLVEDGKLKWDDHVRNHIAWFRLQDPLADREVTIRDLLCHRIGLGRHDNLWYRAPWSLEESVKRLAYLEPNSSFRTNFEYTNLPYIAAGFAIEAASGQPWHEFVRKRLFEPLDMKGVVFTRTEMVESNDRATPHRINSAGKTVSMDWYDDDRQIRASGSIKAGARDLGPWLRMQLGSGMLGEKQIVKKATLEETHRAQMVVNVPASFARDQGMTQAAYGLGWRTHDYRGHQLIEHGGSVDGFRTRITLVPRQQLGFAVLVNLGGTDAPEALSRALLDLFLQLDKKDWNDWYQKRARQEQEAEDKREKAFFAKRVPDTKPSRDLEGYVGDYRHPAYGLATGTVEKENLMLRWSSSSLRLKHFHFDTFLVENDRFAGRTAVFTLDSGGKPVKLEFLDQSFVRKVK